MIRDERGVTLTELILVIAIGALITGVLATAIYQIVDITGRSNAEMVVQHDLRNAAVWLNRDVLSASRAQIVAPQAGIYEMTLEVPHLVISDTVAVTSTVDITYTYYAYTYSEEQERGTLTRDSGDSSFVIARHIVANPFPPPGTIDADDTGVVTVTLRSREGDVPGSGTFALKMRAGEYITAMYLCQVIGAESLGFDGQAVSWVITNTGSTSPTIDEIYIAWPSANLGLALINFNSSPIWAGLQNPISATISGPWLGNREIYSGTQTLEFNFEASAVSDETQYSITITLTDNCTVPFPPNP